MSEDRYYSVRHGRRRRRRRKRNSGAGIVTLAAVALIAGGMENPTGVMKEDWSLAGHFLSEVYEQREDPDGFVSALKDSSASLIDDAKFNEMMDTFDVLKNNNIGK